LRASVTLAGNDAATASSASSTTDCTCTGTRSAMPLRLNARMRSTSDLARIPAASAASTLRRSGGAFARVLLRQLAVAEDRRQDVVEVVGDAAGEGADRLELLRLAQLQLEAVALGLGVLARADVLHRAGHAVGLAVRVAQATPRWRYQAIRPSGGAGDTRPRSAA
jgi:hypothetical protein